MKEAGIPRIREDEDGEKYILDILLGKGMWRASCILVRRYCRILESPETKRQSIAEILRSLLIGTCILNNLVHSSVKQLNRKTAEPQNRRTAEPQYMCLQQTSRSHEQANVIQVPQQPPNHYHSRFYTSPAPTGIVTSIFIPTSPTQTSNPS